MHAVHTTLLAVFLTSSVPLAQTNDESDADTILVGGRIATLRHGTGFVDSIAIRNGLVHSVGTREEILATKGQNTTVIELDGRTVIPGLNDSHLHVVRGGRFFHLELRWDGVRSLKRGLDMIREQAQRTPKGHWVRVIGGWSPHQFIERLYLNDNDISDISVIANYTRLSQLWLNLNFLDISDGSDDRTVIDTLSSRGANVVYEPQKEAPFEGPRFLAKLSGETIQLAWFELENAPNRLEESIDLTNWITIAATIDMEEGGLRMASLSLGDEKAIFFRLVMDDTGE